MRRVEAVGTNGRPRSRALRREGAQTAAAWERFVAHDQVDDRVRPEILMSWIRCRDEYGVDPCRERAPAAADDVGPRALENDMVLAHLAGVARSVEPDVAALNGLIAVTDPAGRILAAWGDRQVLGRAREYNLAPGYAWSEQVVGTNGMGTTLTTNRPTLVAQWEHWCAAFHDWSCAGVAVHDAVTGRPLAAIDVSCFGAFPSPTVLNWLSQTVQGIQDELSQRAARASAQLASTFATYARRASGPLAAADLAGRLLVANRQARLLLGIPEKSSTALHTPGIAGTGPRAAELGDLTLQAVACARRDRLWAGVCRLAPVGAGTELEIAFRPLLCEERVIGVLVGTPESLGCTDGERLPKGAHPASSPVRRLIGLRGDRMIVVAPEELSFAEADGATVWLETDRGRLRAPHRGIGTLERRLHRHGFLRVHRSYLVNLARIREVAPSVTGGYWIILGEGDRARVPVSRRFSATLRAALGI